jgi:hypothetical protein
MSITPRDGLNQYKLVVFSPWDWSCIIVLPRSLTQVSDDDTSTEARQEGEIAQDPPGWLIAPWIFSIKFPYDTQFIFRSLVFAVGEDENIKLLIRGPALKHTVSVYGQPPYLPADSSTLGRASSGLSPYAGSYHRSARTSRGLPIWKAILQPSVGASSSSSLGVMPNRDSLEDYPEIGGSAC